MRTAAMKHFTWAPLLALLLLQGCSAMQQRQPGDSLSRTGPLTIIYVARRGWHIDVGFSTAELEAPLASVVTSLPRSQYVFFGFGDRHYLVAKHKNFPGLLGALWPGAAVVLVTGLVAVPEEAFGTEHVIRLTVTRAQERAAQALVWSSFLNENGVPKSSGSGPYAGSLFFGAAAKYSAVHTCNTWAAEVLQAADLPIRSVGVVFAAQLWSQVLHLHESAGAGLSARIAPLAPPVILLVPYARLAKT